VTLGPIELTTGDIATAFWWTVIAVVVISRRSTRDSLGRVVGAGTHLLGIIALYVFWVALLVLLATRIPFGDQSLWGAAQIKDTVAWFLVSGTVLLFSFDKAATEPHFYRDRLLGIVSGASVLQIFLGLVTFDLWIEILWPVAVAMVGLMLVVLRRDPSMVVPRRLMTGIQGVLLLALVAGVLIVLRNEFSGYDWGAQLQSFLLTVWLTVGALAFVAWLSRYSSYQQAFAHMRQRDGSGPSLKAKLAVLTSFHFQSRELHRFAGSWPRRVARAGGFRPGRRVIREFRADLAARDLADQQRADDLVRYAGAQGTDSEGRQLDRREFAETRAALEWLSTCQMGWYYRPPEGRYKDDLLKIFQPGHTHGLPDEHGIHLSVRRDGQAWYAWRRTISGWVFAIGSDGPPPDQRYYDGPEPPKGYPGSGAGWGADAFDRGPNWES
jgi:hypothetical protein